MMLRPTVAELTNDKVNRYSLVIATAKCARHVTELNYNRAEEAKQRAESVSMPIHDYGATLNEEKAVSVAVNKLATGEYKIITD